MYEVNITLYIMIFFKKIHQCPGSLNVNAALGNAKFQINFFGLTSSILSSHLECKVDDKVTLFRILHCYFVYYLFSNRFGIILNILLKLKPYPFVVRSVQLAYNK